MGRRGPPKKPTDLKLVQGTPGGKHKLNKAEPRPKKLRATVAKPAFTLTARAKKFFKKTAELLDQNSILTEVDVVALSRYADLLDKWLQAKDFIDRNGFSYTVYEDEPDKNGERKIRYIGQPPEVNLYKNFGSELLRLENNFGLTPSARASISVVPKEDDKKKEVEKMLFG